MNADSIHHLAFGSAWLVFLEEIVLEKSKFWMDGKINFTKMDKD